ncbi:MAG: M48 family metallopeptidase [Candidatus Omnitrophota bacterium]|nr:M48 family metallopeptidase [Candidatus Omnitrophota bacterium]
MVDRAKQYSNIKYSLEIAGIIYTFLLIFLFLKSGLSKNLASTLSIFSPGFLAGARHTMPLLLYLFIVSLGYYILNLPLNIYQSYILEHKFSLTTQSLGSWFKDQFKAGAISYVISLILVAAFYLILHYNPASWWLALSIFWIIFSIVLAKLLPIVIIPIFFKYKKLSDENLRVRVMKLAAKMKVKILDCFEIDFSKKTLKANAAFVGIGNTRRVILADTLKDKYSYDEIEVVLAHEFAHYQLKHLLKLVVVNSLSTLAIFYLIFRTNAYILNWFGLSSLNDLASLPVILIYFILFGIITQPLEAFISRSFERSADSLALETTGLKEAFISTMDKLAKQNLSDRSPHPIIKFFFFDHPPIDERIKMARSL